MPKSLAEMRAEAGPVPLPKATRTVTLVKGQHLLDRSRRLNEELLDVFAKAQREAGEETVDEEAQARTRKAGERPPDPTPPPRALEIRDEQARLYDDLTEFQVELVLTGMTGGDWQRFKDANPPRKDNEPDQVLTGGSCNSTAVFDALGRSVTTWEGEQVADGDWNSWLADQIVYADRRDLVMAVVEMHEETIERAPKSRRSSPETQTSGTD